MFGTRNFVILGSGFSYGSPDLPFGTRNFVILGSGFSYGSPGFRMVVRVLVW